MSDGEGSGRAPAAEARAEAASEAPSAGAALDAAAADGRGPQAAAFFDLDRTLMAGSSGIFFARAAYDSGLISRGRLARDAMENLRFRLRGSTDERADAVRRRVGEMIAGVPVRDLQRMAPRVLAGVLPRLYPEMLARAYEHQDAGRPVYIVTAASQEMADLLAHVLDFDGGLGSRSEIVDGVYTGRAAGPFNYREGKVQTMRELAVHAGIDLAASYAYSDSESDLPMLRAVGHPVVVNPDAELTRIADSEGWEVLRFDPLGRRIKVAVALAAAAAAAAGGVGGAVAGRRRSRPTPAVLARRVRTSAGSGPSLRPPRR